MPKHLEAKDQKATPTKPSRARAQGQDKTKKTRENNSKKTEELKQSKNRVHGEEQTTMAKNTRKRVPPELSHDSHDSFKKPPTHLGMHMLGSVQAFHPLGKKSEKKIGISSSWALLNFSSNKDPRRAFLWKCGRLAASSQPTIESMPPRVTEGRSVLLLVRNPPENIVGFLWFKGMIGDKNLLAIRHIPDRKPTVWGPAYSGRETLYSDGSLLIHSVTQNDRGLYTLRILRTDMGSEEARVELQVDNDEAADSAPGLKSSPTFHNYLNLLTQLLSFMKITLNGDSIEYESAPFPRYHSAGPFQIPHTSLLPSS
ncbi:hypothetical protein STEG23_037416, partial [Scotinomys teguina]